MSKHVPLEFELHSCETIVQRNFWISFTCGFKIWTRTSLWFWNICETHLKLLDSAICHLWLPTTYLSREASTFHILNWLKLKLADVSHTQSNFNSDLPTWHTHKRHWEWGRLGKWRLEKALQKIYLTKQVFCTKLSFIKKRRKQWWNRCQMATQKTCGR